MLGLMTNVRKHLAVATRKNVSKSLVLVFIGLVCMPALAAATPAVKPDGAWQVIRPTGVTAGAAIVMDWQTGAVLYERNARQPRDPASTTKVLTAVIALERGNLSDTVRISRRAAYTPGSSMHIRQGEVYSLHDLLHGLLLRSGNDAAVAIAEHIAGSVEAFAELMNAKAKEIGALGSHFANPHGLTEPGHHSTAYDLAVITRYALRNETFASIVSQKSVSVTFENLHRNVMLYNTNRLLTMMPEADGVKTGTTAAAGNCLIASATKDGHKVIAVVLNAGDRWGNAYKLLKWSQDNFRLAVLGRRDQELTATRVQGGKVEQVPLKLAADLAVVMSRKDPNPPEVRIDVLPNVAAPLRQGQPLGRATAYVNGKPLAEAEVVAGRDVAKATLLDRIYRGLLPWLRWTTRGGMF